MWMFIFYKKSSETPLLISWDKTAFRTITFLLRGYWTLMNWNLETSSLLSPPRCHSHLEKVSATDMPNPCITMTSFSLSENWGGEGREGEGQDMPPRAGSSRYRALPDPGAQDPRTLLHVESYADPIIHQCLKKIQERVAHCARHQKKKSSHKIKTAFKSSYG